MNAQCSQAQRTAEIVVRWTLRLVLVAVFGYYGYLKLSGAPAMVKAFDAIGLGSWFRYVTGLVEIGSAILLSVPKGGVFGAALILCTMTGAIVAHLLVLGGSALMAVAYAVAALLLLLLERRTFAPPWGSRLASGSDHHSER